MLLAELDVRGHEYSDRRASQLFSAVLGAQGRLLRVNGLAVADLPRGNLGDAVTRCGDPSRGELGPRLAGPAGAVEWAHVMARVVAFGRPALDLSCNHLDAEAVRWIALGLAGATRLTRLDVSSNQLGLEGASAVASALTGLKGLKELNASGCGLDAAGGTVLAEVLGQLMGLHTFSVSSNHIGAEGYLAIAGALTQLTGLQSLSVR
uniref:Uncharacterized protein n=1 Tax=Cryptomonas curvata TaxID=233186 RepID=A0A7S0MHB5_9CRYP|mmetsp:Transcript_41392/g.86472  ORF Transcript_41392/g.86472 Transcript_41392/m.86472 type:complete len:207 (+) Transcript_41392:2-622(+)